jgi:hypothetical protein
VTTEKGPLLGTSYPQKIVCHVAAHLPLRIRGSIAYTQPTVRLAPDNWLMRRKREPMSEVTLEFSACFCTKRVNLYRRTKSEECMGFFFFKCFGALLRYSFSPDDLFTLLKVFGVWRFLTRPRGISLVFAFRSLFVMLA